MAREYDEYEDETVSRRERRRMLSTLVKVRREAAVAKKAGDRGSKKRAKHLVDQFRKDLNY